MKGREHQVARERGLDRRMSGLLVPRLAHQKHIGILAKEGAENRSERQADVGVGLNLRDPRQVVLDRVFGGRDVHTRLVDLGQCRVERRRLPRSGRAGDVDDAVGLRDHLAHERQRRRVPDQFVEAEARVRFVEETHDDLLAPLPRHGRHAKVDRLALHRHADAAVLRQSLFRDVELAENLQHAKELSEGQSAVMRSQMLRLALVLATIAAGLPATAPGAARPGRRSLWPTMASSRRSSRSRAAGFSPDGRWLAYGINRSNRENELRVAAVAAGETKTIAVRIAAGVLGRLAAGWRTPSATPRRRRRSCASRRSRSTASSAR